MEILFIVCSIVIAYLIGSIPSAVWLGRTFYGIDVRDYGSGNAGATNTFRVLGKKAGSIVMLADVFKGWAATSFAVILTHLDAISTDNLILFKLLLGVLAVVGHIYPIYVNFKGGKGVATLLGMGLSIHLEAALLCILIFVIVFLASRYVSLGSMVATLAFPILLLIPRFNPEEPLLVIFGFVLFAIVVLTHQKNIVRLINGEENRANIRLRKK